MEISKWKMTMKNSKWFKNFQFSILQFLMNFQFSMLQTP